MARHVKEVRVGIFLPLELPAEAECGWAHPASGLVALLHAVVVLRVHGTREHFWSRSAAMRYRALLG